MHKVISSLLQESVEKYKDRVAFNYFDGQWKSITYEEFFLLSRKIASFLNRFDIKKGDKIAIVSENRPEWCSAYVAIILSGCTAVPIDIQLGSKEIRNLLIDSESKAVFYTSKTELNVLKAIEETNIKGINLDKTDFHDEPISQKSIPNIEPDDIASIIYTSGTTGQPKGVILTHKNFCSDAESIIQAGLLTFNDNVLSILPLHHAYPFMCTFLVPIFVGATVTFAPGLKALEIISAIKEKNVTIVVAVPRLLEMIRDGIFKKIRDKKALSVIIFLLISIFWQIKYRLGINLGKLFFKSVHKNFGILKFFTSGGARLDPKVMHDLEAIGFQILEGYGLTETSPVVTFNPQKKRKPGSVGKPLPNVEIKIGKDQEIMIKGPMVTKGYYKNPVATEETIRDEWLMTGDLGYFDKEGYLFVTGRKKEVIVLSTGKNIYPEELENIYLSIPLIKEICITEINGHLQAIIVPDLEYARKNLIGNIYDALQWKIKALSMSLPEYMRIRGFTLYHAPLPRTPLGKLRRFMVKELLTKIQASREHVERIEDKKLLEDEIGKKVADCIISLMKKRVYIQSSDNLELDLGFDSLKKMELLSALETAFSITLPDTFISEVQTVEDIIRKIKEYQVSETKEIQITWKDILQKDPSKEDIDKIGFYYTRLEAAVVYILFYMQKALFKILFRLKVEGKENIPANMPFIIAPNHSSYLDGFVIASSVSYDVFKNLYFLGFQRYFRGRIMSYFARLGHIIPIDPEIHLNKGIQISSYVLRNDKALCIFPEGGRSFDGRLMEFKKGIGILALNLQTQVIPTYIKGTYNALPRGSWLVKPTKITVIFGKPLSANDLDFGQKSPDIDEYTFFSDELRRRVQSLSEFM